MLHWNERQGPRITAKEQCMVLLVGLAAAIVIRLQVRHGVRKAHVGVRPFSLSARPRRGDLKGTCPSEGQWDQPAEICWLISFAVRVLSDTRTAVLCRRVGIMLSSVLLTSQSGASQCTRDRPAAMQRQPGDPRVRARAVPSRPRSRQPGTGNRDAPPVDQPAPA